MDAELAELGLVEVDEEQLDVVEAEVALHQLRQAGGEVVGLQPERGLEQLPDDGVDADAAVRVDGREGLEVSAHAWPWSAWWPCGRCERWCAWPSRCAALGRRWRRWCAWRTCGPRWRCPWPRTWPPGWCAWHLAVAVRAVRLVAALASWAASMTASVASAAAARTLVAVARVALGPVGAAGAASCGAGWWR